MYFHSVKYERFNRAVYNKKKKIKKNSLRIQFRCAILQTQFTIRDWIANPRVYLVIYEATAVLKLYYVTAPIINYTTNKAPRHLRWLCSLTNCVKRDDKHRLRHAFPCQGARVFPRPRYFVSYIYAKTNKKTKKKKTNRRTNSDERRCAAL